MTIYPLKALRRYLISSTNKLILALEKKDGSYRSSVGEVVASSYQKYEHLSLAYAMRRWLSRDYDKQPVSDVSRQAASLLAQKMYEAEDILTVLPSLEAFKNVAFPRVYDEVSTPQILGQCRSYIRYICEQEDITRLRALMKKYGRSAHYAGRSITRLMYSPCDLIVRVAQHTETKLDISLIDKQLRAYPIISCILSPIAAGEASYTVDYVQMQDVKCRYGEQIDITVDREKLLVLLVAHAISTDPQTSVYTILLRKGNGFARYQITFKEGGDDELEIVLTQGDDSASYYPSRDALKSALIAAYVTAYIAPQITVTPDIIDTPQLQG